MYIRSFNEYYSRSFKDISFDDIKDLLYNIEDRYIINSIRPIRFEANSDLSPKKRFSYSKFKFLSEWCDDSKIYPKNFNGKGLKLEILLKGEDENLLIHDYKKELIRFVKNVNRKRLNAFGLDIDIIESSFNSPFVVIYEIT